MLSTWERAKKETLQANGVDEKTKGTVFVVQAGKGTEAQYIVYSGFPIVENMRKKIGESRVVAKANRDLREPLGVGIWLSQEQLTELGIRSTDIKVLLIQRDTQ